MIIDIHIPASANTNINMPWKQVCEEVGQAHKAFQWLDTLLEELKNPSDRALRISFPGKSHASLIYPSKVSRYSIDLSDVPYEDSEFYESIRDSIG